MLKPLLLALLVFVAGSAATTKLRARQELTLLAKLPEHEAHCYLAQLRRRFRRYQILRAVAVIALAGLFFGITKSRTIAHPAGHVAPAASSAPR
jgi:hypothetical protein